MVASQIPRAVSLSGTLQKSSIITSARGIVPSLEKTDAVSLPVDGNWIFRNQGDASSATTVSVGRGPRLGPVFIGLIFWGSAWSKPETYPSSANILGATELIHTSNHLSGL